MKKPKHHKSTLARAKDVKLITAQHYEPGNNRRCYMQIWRHYIYPVYGCCYHTYLNYLGIDPETKEQKEDSRQLRLF